MRWVWPVVFIGAISTIFLTVKGADGFCRTTTCKLPADYSPTQSSCVPEDFDKICLINQLGNGHPFERTHPLWWRNRCVSYSLNVKGTSELAFNDVERVVSEAAQKWTNATCPADVEAETACPDSSSCERLSVATAASRVSLDVRNFGAVECSKVGYFSGQKNQNTIVFRDNTWCGRDPDHPDKKCDRNTLALTTTSFNVKTGELRSADIEVNTADHDFSIDTQVLGKVDLLSVLTHEFGHFFGLSHSADPLSLMYANYADATAIKHELTTDDVAGICSIYTASGNRRVDPSVNGGFVAGERCNPVPEGGFGQTCESPSCRATPASSDGNTAGLVSILAVAFACARRLRKAP